MPDVLTSLALIPIVGITAQWVAWRLGLPSILVLLTAGVALGAGLGLLDPDELFGQLLQPVVVLSVGLILFEGGLSLTRAELRVGERVVVLLLTVGVGVTLGLITVLALVVLDLPFALAAVIGSLLVVTGPTVVGPLLTSIRPRGAVGPILKSEGILVDPLGAVLGVLVVQVVTSKQDENAIGAILFGLAKFALVGLVIGGLGAALATFMLRRYLLPDALVAAFALALALGVVAGANELVDGAGLLAVTITGMAIGAQQRAEVHDLLEFNETIRTLLIASLFVVLGAEVTREQLASIGWRDAVFVVALIIVVRPLVAFLATLGSTLRWQERALLGWMAPRGIVAASAAAVFGLTLQEANVPGSDQVVPIVFVAIFGTIAVYGLTSGPLARRLGLADPDPQGLLILGANPLAIEVGKAVSRHGFRVLLNDPDPTQAELARQQGLEVFEGSLLADEALSDLDLRGIGRLVSLTDDEALTALATMRLGPLFGRREMFQLPLDDRTARVGHDLRARTLFDGQVGFLELVQWVNAGARITEVAVRAHDHIDASDPLAITLFVVCADHTLTVAAADGRLRLEPGDQLLQLVGPA